MPGIIVGVDGSAVSRRALDWAVREAGLRGAALTVLAVHQVASNYWTGSPEHSPADQPVTEVMRRAAEEAVQKAVSQAGEPAPASVTVDRSEVHERRREFAYECDWSQPAPVDPFFENLAADLIDVAYRVALRHGVGDQWLELQLELWGALTAVIEKRSCLGQEIQLPYDPRLDVD